MMILTSKAVKKAVVFLLASSGILWAFFTISLNFISSAHAEGREVETKSSNAQKLKEKPDGATALSQLDATTEELKAEDNFIYDPAGKRDPFKPYRNVRLGMVSKSEISRPEKDLDPLELFDLEKLQVVAILWDVRSPRAIVRTPDGNNVTIFKNSKIGRNFGQVTSIRDGEVVVQEKVFEDGTPRYETKTLSLK